jgi:hypothetical protein
MLMLEALISKYYEFEGAGGTLHVHLDDGNYGQADIKYCQEHDDYFGEVIAMLWNQLTDEEQEQLRERFWEIYEMTETFNRIL